MRKKQLFGVLNGLSLTFSILSVPVNAYGQADTSPYDHNIRVNINAENQNNGSSSSNSQNQNPSSQQSDAHILKNIQNSLKSSYKNYNINVHIKDGFVTITGVVFSDNDKQNIESEVRNIYGVKKVNNKLSVNTLK